VDGGTDLHMEIISQDSKDGQGHRYKALEMVCPESLGVKKPPLASALHDLVNLSLHNLAIHCK
jgi:hypothetical protein